MSAMSNLAIRLAEIRSEVTGKEFDTCLDEVLAEREPHKAHMYETLYGPTTRTVPCTCSRGYDHQALEATHASDTTVSGNKKTAEALVGSAVATGNPLKGTVMTIVTDTTQKTRLAELIERVDATPDGQVQILEPGDMWYQEPTDVRVRPVSLLHPDRVAKFRESIAAREYEYSRSVEFYYLDGAPVPNEVRWSPNFDGDRYATATNPNAIARAGDKYLYVSRGAYYAMAETTLSGEPAIEFLTADKALERMNAKNRAADAAYLAQYPIIEASKPAWASNIDIDLDFYGTNEALVTYEYVAALGSIVVGARHHDGHLDWLQKPYLLLDQGEHKGDPRKLAKALRDLAEQLEAVNA